MQAPTKAIVTALVVWAGSVSFTMGQPEIDPNLQKELELRGELCTNMISWLRTGDSRNASEADRLIDELLRLDTPTVKACLAAAQAANLRGRADQAISILESLVARHPDQDAEVMHVPVKVLASLWVATYAKQAGDIGRAVEAYEETLGNLNGLDEMLKSSLNVLCKLYLAEMDETHFKAPAKAVARLDGIERDQSGAPQEQVPFGFLKNWVAYKKQTLLEGKTKAIARWPDTKSMVYAPPAAVTLLKLVGITDVPLSYSGDKGVVVFFHVLAKRTIEGRASRIDASLVELACAYDYHHKGVIDKASEYYEALLKEDSFLSPVAGMALYIIRMNQGKKDEAGGLLKSLRDKYPGSAHVWDEMEQKGSGNGATP